MPKPSTNQPPQAKGTGKGLVGTVKVLPKYGASPPPGAPPTRKGLVDGKGPWPNKGLHTLLRPVDNEFLERLNEALHDWIEILRPKTNDLHIGNLSTTVCEQAYRLVDMINGKKTVGFEINDWLFDYLNDRIQEKFSLENLLAEAQSKDLASALPYILQAAYYVWFYALDYKNLAGRIATSTQLAFIRDRLLLLLFKITTCIDIGERTPEGKVEYFQSSIKSFSDKIFGKLPRKILSTSQEAIKSRFEKTSRTLVDEIETSKSHL
ncbi:hypothetical protein CYMTET_37044 [Cymbomonas tetramitiformis]|uniref:Uncharacterized protein n=1 Tax=Cymbomonas tetramitiformis TaxID=36881 RepID=A0AAE0CGB3_9CHLO|nr:hypothetical protein CYMTET_37044 [Cymbomonas tetramitiformis]